MAPPPANQITTAGGTGMVTAQLRTMMYEAQRFGRQPGVRRAMPAILIVLAGAAGLFALMALRQPAMQPLYPGLDDSEKAKVVQALTGAGIQSQIDSATGVIEVPSDAYYHARMALAAKGLPESAPSGASMIDNIPMGTSHSVEAARLRLAQEMELARSIEEIRTVKSARVHLAIPEPSAFIRDNQPPRASVVVQMADGRVLEPGQVDAIVNLVASSVAGLARSDVTVVDQTGRLLSQGTDDPAALANDRQLAYRIKLEQLYRRRIEQLISPIVGPGNLAVEVSVDVDFTRSQITRESVDPKGNALRSEQENKQISGAPQARGIPGAISNTPPPDAGTTTTAPKPGKATATKTEKITSQSSSVTRNYEVSRQVEKTTPSTATITRVDAAVLLRTPAGTKAGLPAATRAQIQQLVQSVIGYDAKRGDSVTVASSPFVSTPATPALPWYERTDLRSDLRTLGILVALAIVALGIVRPILTRTLSPAGPLPPLDGGADMIDDAAPRQLSAAETEQLIHGTTSYEERLAVARRIVGTESPRVASVFREMMKNDIDMVN